jgi:tetratricopeptide (TPR) repeat protein
LSDPKRYIAFVSYNHSDRRWAKWVHHAVETYRIPPRLHLRGEATGASLSGRLTPVFLDREELSTSASLADSVRSALEHSRHLIVICSPRGAASRWVNEEVRLFKELGGAERILCVIVDGEPNAAAKGEAAAECFPAAIRFTVDSGQLTTTPAAEPLAADVRPGMDAPRDARLKIVAGLLGVNLDDLRRREQARRHRQLTIIATAATAGCVTLAGLSAAALISRSEAERQRGIAEQQSLTARRTADFMKSLFEVSDPSEARGNSVTAREILDRGVRQIRDGLKDEPLVRADLMTTLGEVYTGLGLYKDGAGLVDDAHQVVGQPQSAHARQATALGEIEFLQGHYVASRASFDEALATLHSSDTADTALLVRTLTGRGDVLVAQEEFAEARRSLNEALALTGNRDDSARARILEGLADAAYSANELNQAEAYYREALELRLRSSGENHPKVANALTTLGSIAYLRGDSANATELYERALKVYRKVFGERHPETAVVMNNLARVYLEDRKFAPAAALLESSRDLKLAEVDETHDDMAFIFSNLALTRVGLGDDAAAEPLFEKALRAAVLHKHRLHGPILTDLADLECRTGRYAAGLKRLEEARPIVTARYPDDPWRAALVDNVRAGCLTGQRQFDEADRLLSGSTPALLAKWGARRLYGYDALQRAMRLYTLTHNETKLAEYRSLARR